MPDRGGRNPFTYARPVDPPDLVDRDLEARQLVSLAEAGHASRLAAPRRYGKTSLLKRVTADAERLGMATVFVDFYGVLSLDEVAMRIEDAYRGGLQGRVRQTAVNLIRTLRPAIRAAPGGVGLEVTPGGEPAVLRLLGRLLDLPVDIFEKTGRRTLVVFDEFQALLGAEPSIDGLVRSRIQHHGDAASYVFAGSEVGLLKQLFDERERPLYGQARPIHLQPIGDADLGDHIAERFERTGRDVGTALEPLLDLVAGHPQRAMLAAHHLWEATEPGATADIDSWAAAAEAVFTELDEAFEVGWNGLKARQRAVLAAVAAGAGSLYDRRTLERFNLSKGSARAARDRLLEVGEHLQRPDGELEFVDPLFREWIRRQHLGSEPPQLPTGLRRR